MTRVGAARAQFYHGGFYCLRERGAMGACFSEWVSEALKLKVAWPYTFRPWGFFFVAPFLDLSKQILCQMQSWHHLSQELSTQSLPFIEKQVPPFFFPGEGSIRIACIKPVQTCRRSCAWTLGDRSCSMPWSGARPAAKSSAKHRGRRSVHQHSGWKLHVSITGQTLVYYQVWYLSQHN